MKTLIQNNNNNNNRPPPGEGDLLLLFTAKPSLPGKAFFVSAAIIHSLFHL